MNLSIFIRKKKKILIGIVGGIWADIRKTKKLFINSLLKKKTIKKFRQKNAPNS